MLEVKKLSGGYANIPVLKDVSFQVTDGELVGLIGLNGAGKSTTIKEIIGLLTPYEGQILIDGQTLLGQAEAYRKKIGFIPETPSLYEELTLREHLEVVALAYDLDWDAAFERAEKLLKLFRLEEKLDWFPVHFSKGMKQKVMIICAFMVQPSLLIVDEPFLGLDPVAIQDLIDLLEQEKRGELPSSCPLMSWILRRRCVIALSFSTRVKCWQMAIWTNCASPLVRRMPASMRYT